MLNKDLRKPKVTEDTLYIIVDRWQLALDTMDRNLVRDRIFDGTEALVFSSFDFEEARQEWFRLMGPQRDRNPERKRYALLEVAVDAP